MIAIHEKEFPILPGYSKNFIGENFEELNIQVSLTFEQINHLNACNVDAIAVTQNKLIEETYLSLSKKINALAFRKNDTIKKIKCNEFTFLKQFFGWGSILLGPSSYIAIQEKLMDSVHYISTPMTGTIMSGGIYLGARLKASLENDNGGFVNIYVNPWINFDNNCIAIVPDECWSFDVKEDFMIKKIKDEKTIIKIEYGIGHKDFFPIVFELIN